jgi:flagellar protein FlaG
MSVASVGTIPVSPVPHGIDFREHPLKQNESVKQNDAAAQKEKSHAIHSTAADLQQIGQVFNKKLQFVVDHHSQQVIVKVIDKETDKVIKELPPEELQRLHKNLKEAVGLLFDELV